MSERAGRIQTRGAAEAGRAGPRRHVVPYFQERALPSQRSGRDPSTLAAAYRSPSPPAGRCGVPCHRADLGLHGIQLSAATARWCTTPRPPRVRHEVNFDAAGRRHALLAVDAHWHSASNAGLSVSLHTPDSGSTSRRSSSARRPNRVAGGGRPPGCGRPADGDTRGEAWHSEAAQWAEELSPRFWTRHTTAGRPVHRLDRRLRAERQKASGSAMWAATWA